MFTWIGNLISGLFDSVVNLAEFIINFFRDIAVLSQLLTGFASGGIAGWITFLPTTMVTTVCLCISIAIAFKVLGRE